MRPCHRALPDAEATAEILLRLIGMAQERGARTVGDLVELAATKPRRVQRKRSLAFGAPQRPGVYLFRDKHDQVLYVGRARDLRARLRSYFRSDRQRPAVEAALAALERVEWRVLGSELEAALEELRLIRELRPPANARSVRPDRYLYLRRRGDSVVCTSQPTELGPLTSRKRAQLASRALQGVEWETLDDALPKLRAKLKRLARDLRFEDAARLRDRIDALEDAAREIRRMQQLRQMAVCIVVPGERAGSRRAFFVAKGQVVGVRPFVGPRRSRVAGGARSRRPGRADARARGGRRAPGRRVVHPAAAAGARGAEVGTLAHMEQLHERALGDGWRKLVVDGVTATPVDVRRGAAVKVVDGPRTETVPRAEWPAQARRAARRRAQRAPARRRTATCTRGARRRATWLVSSGKAVVGRGAVARARPRALAIRCPPTTRCSARRRSRATRSGRCSTTSSCSGRCRSGSASASASSTPAAARRT